MMNHVKKYRLRISSLTQHAAAGRIKPPTYNLLIVMTINTYHYAKYTTQYLRLMKAYMLCIFDIFDIYGNNMFYFNFMLCIMRLEKEHVKQAQHNSSLYFIHSKMAGLNEHLVECI